MFHVFRPLLLNSAFHPDNANMNSKPSFDPIKNIPSLAERVFFITGGRYRVEQSAHSRLLVLGTAGLGKETILALSRHSPKHIYFTGRNTENATDVISQAKAIGPSTEISFIKCDQTSLSSVESAVKQFLSVSQRLDVLICNAGVMGIDPGLTIDGFEKQFGINHVAHALIVKMLLPPLQRNAALTGNARIIFLSSVGFRWTPSGGIVFKDLKTTQDYAFAGRWVRYGQSKLANVVYANELARRYPEITSVSIHPGVIFTDLWNTNLSLLNRAFVYLATIGQGVPIHEGVYNSCWAATTQKENLTSGTFYEPVGVVGAQTKNSKRKDLGVELWDWTQKELEGYG